MSACSIHYSIAAPCGVDPACNGNGDCVMDGADYGCDCYEGWMGETCGEMDGKCFIAIACHECRRQVKNVHKIFKNDKILEFHDHIWNHHGKCIQKSPNMPGIGSLIREIDVQILKN